MDSSPPSSSPSLRGVFRTEHTAFGRGNLGLHERLGRGKRAENLLHVELVVTTRGALEDGLGLAPVLT
jgi:hypothetical protein